MTLPDLSGLRTELAVQATEMDDRAFDLMPAARRYRQRFVLQRRLVATAGSLTLLAGLVVSLPEHAQNLPAPPVVGTPSAEPPARPPITVGRTVFLSPGVTLRFENSSTVAITLPDGPAPGRRIVRHGFDKTRTGEQSLYSGALPNGQALAVFAVPVAGRTSVDVVPDSQTPARYQAGARTLAFARGWVLVHLRYPQHDVAMKTPGTVGSRDTDGIFLRLTPHLQAGTG